MWTSTNAVLLIQPATEAADGIDRHLDARKGTLSTYLNDIISRKCCWQQNLGERKLNPPLEKLKMK